MQSNPTVFRPIEPLSPSKLQDQHLLCLIHFPRCPHTDTHTHIHTPSPCPDHILEKHEVPALSSISLSDEYLNLSLILDLHLRLLQIPAALHPIINSYGSSIIWQSKLPQKTQVSNYGVHVIRDGS